MQSMTTGTLTGTESYGPCMVSVGRWANNDPNLLANAQLAAEAKNLYNQFYNIYLQTMGDASTTSVRAVRTTQPTTGTQATRRRRRTAAQRPRQRTGTTRQQQAASRRATPARQRVRTPAGTPGPSDARVLAAIVRNPNISIDLLRRRVPGMRENIVGTCVARLLAKRYISGTAKIGPFTATNAGINANSKQPTSIGQARSRRTPTTRAVTTQAVAEQPTGTSGN